MGRKTNVGPLGIAELMSGAELMNGTKSRKWVHQKPTNQPTNPKWMRPLANLFGVGLTTSS